MRALASRVTTLSFALILLFLPHAFAQTYGVLASFNCATDGCGNQQIAPLAQGRDGDLYGQSYSGGTNNDGTIWGVSPTSTFNILWSLADASKNNSHGGLTLGLDGNFYGASAYGGTSDTGFIFKLTSSGVLTNLKSFNDCVDGGFPYTPPVLGPDGNFYGYVLDCAPHFYKITSAGKYTAITTTVPTYPGPLLLASDGNFYGISSSDGTNHFGTVFRVTTSGKLTVLHNFTGTDGESSFANLVQGSDGLLYGTTPSTTSNAFEGTLFKISTTGTFTLLHTLASSGAEGSNMFSGLVAATDGNFYGNTVNGGTFNDGVVFQMTPTGTVSVIHNFGSTTCDSGNAWLPLSERTDGTLYGVTNLENSCTGGNVFTLTSAAFTPFLTVEGYSAHSGQTINILGSSLSGSTAVNFGSIPATSFKVVSPNYMTAVVPPTATTSVVSVTTKKGTVSTRGNFKVPPTVLSFSPPSGTVGTVVTINGTGFTGATSVTFGGVKATQFTVTSATLISATVPAGAKTGNIAVTTVGGSGSKGTFTVN